MSCNLLKGVSSIFSQSLFSLIVFTVDQLVHDMRSKERYQRS